MASVLEAERGQVSLDQVLDIKAFSMERALAVEEEQHKGHDSHDHDHAQCSSHHHDDSVTSVTLESHQPIPLEVFRQWLAKWLWPDTDTPKKSATQIFRVKGYVYIAGHDTKHQLQGVHELFDLQPSNVHWAAGEPKGSRVVVIGRQVKIVLEDWRRAFAH